MKKLILITLLALTSCGEYNPPPDYSHLIGKTCQLKTGGPKIVVRYVNTFGNPVIRGHYVTMWGDVKEIDLPLSSVNFDVE